MIEISPCDKINSKIAIPGSKYVANRLLIIAALAKGVSKITNMPYNDDIESSISALKSFGICIEEKNKVFFIKGSSGNITEGARINVLNSGTLLRFITSFACLSTKRSIITGSKRIRQRPIQDLVGALNLLGAKTESTDKFAPVIVNGGGLVGGKISIDGRVSSQFLSSLLLVSPYAKEDVEIAVINGLVSKVYVDLTIKLMNEFGVDVERTNYSFFRIKAGQRYKARAYLVPIDPSSANYFFAASAMTKGKIVIQGRYDETHPEASFLRLLEKMGAIITISHDSIEVKGNRLIGIDCDMSRLPDSAMTLAAVACFAEGKTRIRNIGHLRYKESDRIKDFAEELSKFGQVIRTTDKDIMITPAPLRKATIDPHNDHRVAMSLSLIGLLVGAKIKYYKCVNKSFPLFWDRLGDLGVRLKW